MVAEALRLATPALASDAFLAPPGDSQPPESEPESESEPEPEQERKPKPEREPVLAVEGLFDTEVSRSNRGNRKAPAVDV